LRKKFFFILAGKTHIHHSEGFFGGAKAKPFCDPFGVKINVYIGVTILFFSSYLFFFFSSYLFLFFSYYMYIVPLLILIFLY